jgi:DNA-binding response OmpR family regulator
MARVLVVDDEPDLRELVRTVLTYHGHQVALAEDGEKALEVLASQRPEVMVLDLMMPNTDGFGVLKEMKRQGMTGNVKTLVLTCMNRESDWLRGYKHGAHQYLTKPFDPEELADKVEMLLSMSESDLARHREAELDTPQLLSRLESLGLG